MGKQKQGSGLFNADPVLFLCSFIFILIRPQKRLISVTDNKMV